MITIFAWLAVIIAVEALTELITSSSIMFPIRDWFSKPPDETKKLRCPIRRSFRWLRGFIGELLNCGYCTSVWVALLLAHFAPTGKCVGCVLYAWPIFFIKVLVIHRLSNIVHELFSRWFSRSPFSFVLTHIHNNGDKDGPKES